MMSDKVDIRRHITVNLYFERTLKRPAKRNYVLTLLHRAGGGRGTEIEGSGYHVDYFREGRRFGL